jgi:hypothetical protein
MVPDLEDVSLEIRSTIGNTAFDDEICITHEQEGNTSEVIFRTMEFWLMSSENVDEGFKTEILRPGSRLIVYHGGALK